MLISLRYKHHVFGNRCDLLRNGSMKHSNVDVQPDPCRLWTWDNDRQKLLETHTRILALPATFTPTYILQWHRGSQKCSSPIIRHIYGLASGVKGRLGDRRIRQ